MLFMSIVNGLEFVSKDSFWVTLGSGLVRVRVGKLG